MGARCLRYGSRCRVEDRGLLFVFVDASRVCCTSEEFDGMQVVSSWVPRGAVTHGVCCKYCGD
jgi:hypothetical protein